MGYTEAFYGLGLCIGPLMGSVIYSSVGYELTFLIIAGMLALAFLVVIIVMPNKFNMSGVDQNGSTPASYTYFLNRRSVFGALSCAIPYIMLLFNNGILSLHLVSVGLSEAQAGYVFAL